MRWRKKFPWHITVVEMGKRDVDETPGDTVGNIPPPSLFGLPLPADISESRFAAEMAMDIARLVRFMATQDFVAGRRFKLKIDAADVFTKHLVAARLAEQRPERDRLEADAVRYVEILLSLVVADAQVQSFIDSHVKIQACLPPHPTCPYALQLRMLSLKGPAKRAQRQLLADYLRKPGRLSFACSLNGSMPSPAAKEETAAST